MSLLARFRALLRPHGGTMPKPPPLDPGEEHVILSSGWNWPMVETSSNYRGRGRYAYLRTVEQGEQKRRRP